jgi:hypothetical protein
MRSSRAMTQAGIQYGLLSNEHVNYGVADRRLQWKQNCTRRPFLKCSVNLFY